MKPARNDDSKLPRSLADTIAIYAIVLVVALCALLPLRIDLTDPVASTVFAGRPPAAAAQADDARDR